MDMSRQFLTQVVAPCGIWCFQCQAPVSIGLFSSELDGLVMWLPHMNLVKEDRYLWNHEEMNHPNAFNHPALPLLTSTCGHVAYCLPMTSFGKMGLAAKIDSSRKRGTRFDSNWFMQFVNSADNASCTSDNPANQAQEALFYDGPAMKVQSYVGLTNGYWIEVVHLNEFKLKTQSRCKLQLPSLQLLAARFASAEFQRRLAPDWCESSTAKLPFIGYPLPYPTQYGNCAHARKDSGYSSDGCGEVRSDSSTSFGLLSR